VAAAVEADRVLAQPEQEAQAAEEQERRQQEEVLPERLIPAAEAAEAHNP
jgi:hypothetical protein